MKIVEDKISIAELKEMAGKMFGNLVKVVVDVEKEIMAVDGELHADEQALLLENDSQGKNLWGANVYPDKSGDEFIEFDSVINISPVRENRSRGVESKEIRENIIRIIHNLVEK